jgi:hypothetical protein
MITYLYWAAVLAVAGVLFWSLGFKARQWRGASIAGVVTLLIGWSAYFFYFENLFVKRLGGRMSISTPQGQQHLATTWKDDNLWVETYDPKTNKCIFSEYSRGNVLQGRVVINNCNPR